MDQNLAILWVMAIAITAAVILILGMTSIRARRRFAELTDQATRDAGLAARLGEENEILRGRLEQQEDRLQVLERIATDPSERTAREIETLRIT